MRVFLSWSGKTSKAAATAFRDWIPFVLNAVEPWMSANDIEAGARWGPEIAQELEQSQFGILFVTPTNTTAPWLLFEAGALAKKLTDTYVCPYLLGFQDPNQLGPGPLTQFQAKLANRDDTLELVGTINTALADAGVPPRQAEQAFDKWWPDLEAKLEQLPKEGEPARRTTDDILGEILVIARRLDRQATSDLSSSMVTLGMRSMNKDALDRVVEHVPFEFLPGLRIVAVGHLRTVHNFYHLRAVGSSSRSMSLDEWHSLLSDYLNEFGIELYSLDVRF